VIWIFAFVHFGLWLNPTLPPKRRRQMLSRKGVATEISDLRRVIQACSWAVKLLRDPTESRLIATTSEINELLSEFTSLRRELRKEYRRLKRTK